MNTYNHVYKNAAGKRLPSVSTINKNLGWNHEVLMKWQAKMFRSGKDPDQVTENACNVGNLVHLYIEYDILGKKPTNDELKDYSLDDIVIAEQGLRAFKDFEAKHNITWKHSELELVHEGYQYGGCVDGIGMFDDKLTLSDNKTSTGVWIEQIIQVAAYRELWNHNNPDTPIEQVCIIHISKEPTPEEIIKPYFVPNDMLDTCRDVFLSLVDLHNKHKVLNKQLKQMKG